MRDWNAPHARQFAASCGGTAKSEIPPERAPQFPVESARKARDKASRKIAKAPRASQDRAPHTRKILRDQRRRPRNARNSNARRASSFYARQLQNRILPKAGTSCAPLYSEEVRLRQ